MDIFGQLGINTTAAFQFVLFCVALIFLINVVFKPYARAQEERERRTKGGENLALDLQNKSVELQSEYEIKMRDLNDEIKLIVDAAKAQAGKEYDAAVGSVRADTEKMAQSNRTNIALAVQTAAQELKLQTTAVALTITNKLLK